jgi:hypothetical protein
MSQALDRTMRLVAMDFDGRPWPVIAAWLFGTQVVLFLISRVVDAIWFPETSYGFFAAMLLFAGHVFLDALTVGMSAGRALLWATAVTVGWVFGAISYARRRAGLTRQGG